MFDFEIEFDDMGLVADDGWNTGSFSGIAHFTEIDGEAIVVDITVERNKIKPDRKGYLFERRMLDRTKPSERILFHQLSDAVKITLADSISYELETRRPRRIPAFSNISAGRTL